MKLSLAIEILEDYLRGDEPDKASDLPDSIRLGREALLRVNELRKSSPAATYMPLRGETGE